MKTKLILVLVGAQCRITDNQCNENGTDSIEGVGIFALGIRNHIEGNTSFWCDS